MKIAIIGSGISGVCAAKMLKGDHEVEVFERNSSIGGLIKCERFEEGLFHRVGGHVFNSKNSKVLDWFWANFNKEEEFVQVKRNAKVLFNDSIIGYPIENYLYMLDKEKVSNIMRELIELQGKQMKDPFSYPDFETFLKGNFGNTLFDIYFGPYNNKIWQVDLKTVSMEWLEGKLPMPDFQQIIISNVLREGEDMMVHSNFYYPRTGGSQFLINRLALGLTIHRNADIKEISWKRGKFRVGENDGFDRVVYTGDVRTLPSYCQAVIEEANIDFTSVKKLRSNGTSNLFCETDSNELSWLYIPQDFTAAHRIIYTGNFAESNNSVVGRKTCVVEFSGFVSRENMNKEIKKLPGNLKPIAHNYEPNSYLLHGHGTRQLMSNVKAGLEAKGIFLLGRFAEWEYYNMDKCMESCFSLVNRINN